MAIIFFALLALSLCGKRETIVNCAIEKLGTPYETLDCSGIVRYWYRRIGIQLNSIAHNQFAKGRAVTKEELKPGDIVGFYNHDGKKQPGHVGIFVGDDKYIHSPGRGKVVTYGVLSTNRNFFGGRNYID